jgi:molybdopterin-guanine dinucleotide biosynthesis protein A
MGGIDKAVLVVGGKSLLERALDATRRAARTVVVGPRRSTSRPVIWAWEEPPGGGPVAALATGLAHTADELVAVVAVDLPHLGADHLETLAVAGAGRDGAIFVDGAGRDQPLAGVYRADRLRTVLGEIAVTHGAPVHELVALFDLARVPDEGAARDLDTPEELRMAREAAQGR